MPRKGQNQKGRVDFILIESALSGAKRVVMLAHPRAPPIFPSGSNARPLGRCTNKQDDILQTDQFQREHVNMGIAIVVPVQKIIETMNQPKLVKRRERDMARIAPSKPGS
jgi:hypothetical protein